MTLALRYAVRSDVGLLREGNEDSAYAGPHLLAIADGMGGHAAGEVASAVAISAIAGLDDAVARGTTGDPLEALAAAVASASATLHQMSLADRSVEGMGTTLTAMLWTGGGFAVCHIGDSRAYLLRDGEFGQITRDHTLVQTLVDDGQLTPAQAASHPKRSLVMRALQGGSDTDPDLSIREARAGDRYLLCSDGLSDVVGEETLRQALSSIRDREEAVRQLITLANSGGGPDNITCIVADVVDAAADPGPAQRPVLAGAASGGDGRPVLYGDSPATRAHRLLARSAAGSGPVQAPGGPADGYRTGVSRDGRGGSGGARPAAGGRAQPMDGYQDDEADEQPARRRWPVVTSILVILVLVIVGGGYAAWRYTQSQYYVGTDGQQVVIYRGINERVAGISLSSVYQRTGIPMSHVPAADADAVRSTTSPGSLATAQRVVRNIRHAYLCQQAYNAQQAWRVQVSKLKPKRVTVIVHGKKRTRIIQPKKPPEPSIPASCPPQGASG
jgi:serine/threonine protein phosphatase PrpC